MRRLLSITLLLAGLLPVIAPLAALGESTQRRVMLCCLKGGAHHCMDAGAADGTQIRAKNCCPAGQGMAGPVQGERAGVVAAVMLPGEWVGQDVVVRQVEARARVARERARGMRGPPVVVLS